MDFFQDLFVLKQQLLESVFPQFQYVASSIGGIAATILITTVVLNAYINSCSIDWGLMLRPFCIAFVLSVFPVLIIQPLDSLAQATNKWMYGICKDSKSQKQQLKQQIRDKIASANTIALEDMVEVAGNIDADNERIEQIFQEHESNDTFSNEISLNWTQRALIDTFTWIVEQLTYVAQLFVSFMGVVYLLLLSLTGPITFALAIIPAFKTGITSWFARYIQIMLYMPLAQIFMFLMQKSQNIILESALATSDMVTYPTLTMWCLNIVSIIGLFKIPTIAEWVVESSGGQAFGAAVNRVGASVAGKAATVARKMITKV